MSWLFPKSWVIAAQTPCTWAGTDGRLWSNSAWPEVSATEHMACAKYGMWTTSKIFSFVFGAGRFWSTLFQETGPNWISLVMAQRLWLSCRDASGDKSWKPTLSDWACSDFHSMLFPQTSSLSGVPLWKRRFAHSWFALVGRGPGVGRVLAGTKKFCAH